MKLFLALILINTTSLFASEIIPPLAPEKKHQLEKHNDLRSDEYYWLKDRKNPEVIKYLKSENNYLNTKLKHTENLQKTLFTEMKSRIKEDDSTYPLKNESYYYYTRFEKGQQYPIYARKTDLSSKEEIIFNVNKLAKGKSFYSAGYTLSPNHQLAALAYDTTGRRFYNIKFKDLKTGKFINTEIKAVTNNVVWANDNETLFYTKQDAETLRWNQIYKYNLKNKKTELVYTENQDTFEVSLDSSLIKKHIFININSTLSSEVRIINSSNPNEDAKLLFKREPNHELSVTEDEDFFYIQTNKNAKDFKILRTLQTNPSLENAEIWLNHRDGIHIDNFVVFKNEVVISSREKGLTQIEIYDKKTKSQKKLTFEDTAYTVEIGANAEYNPDFVRYTYYSLRSPTTIYDYYFKTQKSEIKKVKEVPGYNAENYKSERIFAKSRDGRSIPISLLMNKNTKLDGTNPILIYAYGSYGATLDPWFSSVNLSLVDRGYIFAIAHIRGGGEMGRYWTDEGRTLNKKNTFFDFIDCTEYLISEKYANPKKVFAMGGSAGGLLMGAIANYRPDLYKGIIAQVPFVDVLTTMLDDTIPLTTSEYDEWGNPNEKKYYDYIKTYSPYDNVTKQSYPHMLITTGLHDSQVQYWEPAKWTARLRKLNTSNNFIFLKTDMSAGHGGKTGRFEQLKDDAFEFAFILDTEKK